MSEAEIQKTVASYLDWHRYLWFHPVNEGKRSVQLSSMMKAQGMKAGVPDVCILEPRNGYHGLFIELKVEGNRPTEKQLEWIKRLSERGYATAVCWSADDAIKVVEEYMHA